MATGCELKMLEPDVNDYIFIPKRIAAFLKEIFPESENKENNHLTLQDILNNSSRMSEIFANKTKNVSKIKYSLPHIKIEELLYDEFFRDENDPFYKNYKIFTHF